MDTQAFICTLYTVICIVYWLTHSILEINLFYFNLFSPFQRKKSRKRTANNWKHLANFRMFEKVSRKKGKFEIKRERAKAKKSKFNEKKLGINYQPPNCKWDNVCMGIQFAFMLCRKLQLGLCQNKILLSILCVEKEKLSVWKSPKLRENYFIRKMFGHLV